MKNYNKKKDTQSSDQARFFLSDTGRDDGTDDMSDNETSQYSVNEDMAPMEE